MDLRLRRSDEGLETQRVNKETERRAIERKDRGAGWGREFAYVVGFRLYRWKIGVANTKNNGHCKSLSVPINAVATLTKMSCKIC